MPGALGTESEWALERRLMELEVKASYADDLLDVLNTLVTRQQAQIDRLLEEVANLRRRGEDHADPHMRSLRDELPPHY
jgi:SlyX protein